MWTLEKDYLHQKFHFKDPTSAILFVSKASELINSLDLADFQLLSKPTVVDVSLPIGSQEIASKIDDFYSQVISNDSVNKLEVRNVKIYADGGSRGNPGPSASGFVIVDFQNNILVEKGIYLGVTTNNQAEYQSLKLALEEAHKLGVLQVEVFMDSLLVINQMLGKFKIKNRDLWSIYTSIKELIKLFNKVSFTHVPRELNKLADRMVNIALDKHINDEQT